MRNQRTIFLAGIAAIALFAGPGVASAQENPQNHKTATQPNAAAPTLKSEQSKGAPGQAQSGAKTGNTTQVGKMGEPEGGTRSKSESAQGNVQKGKMGQMEKSPAETKTGKTTERANESSAQGAGTNAKENERRADDKSPGSKANKAKMDDDRAAQGERTKEGASTTAEQRRERGPNTAEQQGDRLRGLQGNATGSNVTFNDEQRTKIRETVIDARGAPRVGRVNFDVRVGTAIPRGRIHIVPVPEMLVQIQPEWRGFLYFVYQDELVIVDPSDMRIIAVVAV